MGVCKLCACFVFVLGMHVVVCLVSDLLSYVSCLFSLCVFQIFMYVVILLLVDLFTYVCNYAVVYSGIDMCSFSQLFIYVCMYVFMYLCICVFHYLLICVLQNYVVKYACLLLLYIYLFMCVVVMFFVFFYYSVIHVNMCLCAFVGCQLCMYLWFVCVSRLCMYRCVPYCIICLVRCVAS